MSEPTWLTPWLLTVLSDRRSDWVRYGRDAQGHPGFRHLIVYDSERNDRQDFRLLVDDQQMSQLIGEFRKRPGLQIGGVS